MRRARCRERGCFHAALLALVMLVAGGPAVAGRDKPVDFTSLSLEELMEIEVTSVSKKAERLRDAPAAVYVITAEEIRRSGATTLPEVLRMVPGLQVARTGAHTWEISARGFRYRMANKFLVLVDGRAVYTPVYGTVLWEDQDLALENIERIEVIRGPGATLWGSNAVNGVINITTKSAVETQGTLVSLHAGNEDTLGLVLRRGGMIGDRAWWRVAARGFRADDLVLESGRPGRDGWSGGFVEGRIDWESRGGDEWSAQVHHHDHDRRLRTASFSLVPPFVTPVSVGVDFSHSWGVVSWRRDSREGGRWHGRGWIDRGRSNGSAAILQRTTVDGLLEYAGPGGRRHQWFWGIGARNVSLRFRGENPGFAFRPPVRSDQIYSGYLQDDIALGPGHAHLVLGTKVEYTSASGLEVQPQARGWWRWSPAWMAWAAVSRAARTPSWVERSVDWLVDVSLYEIPGIGTLPVATRLRGSPRMRAEHQLSHEAGFRWTPGKRFSLDVSGYWNEYRGLASFDGTGFEVVMLPSPHGEATATYANRARVRFKGLEVVARWRPTERLRWEAWWSWLEGRILDSSHGSGDALAAEREMYLGVNSRHQVHLRGSLDLSRGWELDGSLHWTDRLENGSVPSWTRLDLRVGWHSPTRDREWSLALRDALGRRVEFRYFLDRLQVDAGCAEPSVVSRWTWRF